MNVSEVKALLPEADVYSLSPEANYLVVIRSGLFDMGTVQDAVKTLHLNGINAVVAQVNGDPKDVRIFKDAPV